MIEFGLQHFLAGIDALGWTLLAALALLSLTSWTFFIAWILRSVFAAGHRRRFAARVLGEGNGIADAMPPVPGGAAREAALLAEIQESLRLTRAGECFTAAGGLAAHLTRALRQHLDRAAVAREGGLTLLATTAATAPYLGLLGTVWGIYHALVRIGSSGEAGLAAVAGPVGEALIMTALGLAVAIPAVFAHNHVQRRNRLAQAALEDFATTLLRRATVPAMPAEDSVGERALGLAVVGRSAEV